MNAIQLLERAVEFDNSGRHVEAVKLYEEGAEGLATMARNATDPAKRRHFEAKIQEYRNRAKLLKDQQERMRTKGEIKDKILIVENSTGHSYKSLFGKYLDGNVKEILVEEPYLREHFQLTNLVMFCELAVVNCKNLKCINVKTTKAGPDQLEAFKQLNESLKTLRGVNLSVEFSDHIHDRQILLSNGHIIKIGRGLNYFKKAEKYCLGTYDFDFRECRETNVDILFCPENIK
ncbi:MIT domain-containing protein 1 [Lutzomyia longipalpis]|uniref:MIT domain-containing protein 1 n=1 Tax=Lutzomyia longipalpis TaxID=7200 RepID=UPI0024842C5B|nr:MIT domain-containing protein 1 [Lutzomyia longipalpis]